MHGAGCAQDTDVLGVQGDLRRDEQNDTHNFDQYVQGDWRFADAWSLSAGLRHSQDYFTADDNYITATNGDDSGKTDYSATSPVAGLMFRASERWHLYASYGHNEGYNRGEWVTAARRDAYDITEWLARQGAPRVHGMNLGGAWKFDFGRVKYVMAVHSSTLPDGSSGGNPGGFVVEPRTSGTTVGIASDGVGRALVASDVRQVVDPAQPAATP